MAAPAHAAGTDDWVVVENQHDNPRATGSLTAYDPAATDWTSSSAVKWQWAPKTTENFTLDEVNNDYYLPTDFRFRDTPQGQRFVVTSSEGMAAIVDFASGVKKWGVELGANDLHAAELLPNGNVVVGSTSTVVNNGDSGSGGFLRVYASSQQGTAGLTYAEYPLNDAHEVLWDPTFDRLWAIGENSSKQYVLDSFAITGSAANPHITLATQKILPGSHDVNADPSNPNALLLASGTDLESYDKVSGQLTVLNAFPSTVPVKSLTEQPSSGELVSTQVDGSCALNDGWCTGTVHLYTSNSSGGYTDSPRPVMSGQIYRARVWNPSYSGLGDAMHGAVTDHMLSGGAWTSTVEDAGTGISQISAAALPGGTMHVQTLVPGWGVYDHALNADGTSQSPPTLIDANTAITAISSAVVGTTLHVQTVVPGYGVYDRALNAGGTWDSSATRVDPNANITQTAASAVGNTLHLETLVPGYGVYDNSLNPATNLWGNAVALPAIPGTCTTDVNTACTVQVSATSRADGTLHVQELAPGAGVYDLTFNGSAWAQPVPVDSNPSITRIAASTLSTSGTGLDLSGDTHLETVVPTYGVYDRTLAPGISSTWAGGSTQIDATTTDFAVYGAGTKDGALHVGSAAFPLS